MSGFLCAMVGASFTVAAAAEVLRSKKGITAVGNAQVDTAQSQFGGASALFDGTGDRLDITAAADLAFGSSDFTIECWVRYSSVSGNQSIIDFRDTGANGAYILLGNNGGAVYLFVNGDYRIGNSGTQFAINTWYHVALSRSGTSTKLFINGTQSGSTYSDSNSYLGTSPDIGELNSSFGLSGFGTIGHIDEFRISNTARYTTTFTPSTTAFVNDANTLLLIHANGTDASTFFEDDNGVRAPNGITAGGNAQVDTAQSKFSGASALFDGTGDYLQMPFNASINRFHDNTNFTVEYWIRVGNFSNVASGAGYNASIVFGNQTVDNFAQYWSFGPIANGNVQFFYYSGTNNQYTTSGVTLVTNTWYHLAFVKQTNSLKIYIDGVERGSGTITNTPSAGTTSDPITIGSFNSVSFNGYLDEIRVSNSARYTAGFTPSTTPFVNDSNTLLLIHADGTDGSTVFRDDNGTGRSAKGITAVGNAQVDTAQSKFGGSSAQFDGTGDYLKLGASGDFEFGSSNWTVEGFIRPTNNLSGYKVLYNHNDNGTDRSWFTIQLENATLKSWGTTSTGSWNVYSDLSWGSLSVDTWYHFALVRDGSTMRAFLNGTQINTASCTGWTIPAQTAAATLSAVPSSYWYGWMDEIRISNIARYTTGFSAPTAQFQSDANTLLLLHMDGTDASTAFFDDNGIAPYTP